MEWWHGLVALADVYLLVSLGPWIALLVLQWLTERATRPRAARHEALQRLSADKVDHQQTWPALPRPGRYGEVDRAAARSLADLAAAVDVAERLWPTLVAYSLPTVTIGHALGLQAWGPLRKTWQVYRDANAFRVAVQRGQEAAAALNEGRRIIDSIPERMRGLLNETRAELGRLAAAGEAEAAAGTAGMGDILERVRLTESQVEGALDRLNQMAPNDAPQIVLQTDAFLADLERAVHEIDSYLGKTAQEREQASKVAERLTSGLGLAAERWEGLKTRGVKDPDVAAQLSALNSGAQRLAELLDQRTIHAYRQVNEDIPRFDEQMETMMRALDALEGALQASREGIKGDVQLLGQAQGACDEVVRQDPLVLPDASLATIERATAVFKEAERQYELGTLASYEAAATHASGASEQLTLAEQTAKELPAKAAVVRELLNAATSEVLGDWRSRADRAREQLMIYPRHWDEKLAGSAGEALAQLEQAEVDLERISAAVRYQRQFRQSELGEATLVLTHARECIARARQLVEELELEAKRVLELKEEVDKAAKVIAAREVAALAKAQEHMLPELQVRNDELMTRWDGLLRSLGDVNLVNYDEAASDWLPSLHRELEELILEHDKSVDHYRRALTATRAQLDRQWTRLARLGIDAPPHPEENTDRLSLELDEWRKATDRAASDPHTLRDLVGKAASSLEQRIETAQRQVLDGRRTLSGLRRTFEGHSRAAHELRRELRELHRGSPWPNLTWDTDEADRGWERSMEHERNAQVAHTLPEACEEMQRAVEAVERAEQLYTRAYRQALGALRHLGEAVRGINTEIARAQRQAAACRAQGRADEASALDLRRTELERTIQTAEVAATFEDALRYLKDVSGG